VSIIDALFPLFIIATIIGISILTGIGLMVVVAFFAEEFLKNYPEIVFGIFVIATLGTFLYLIILLQLALEAC